MGSAGVRQCIRDVTPYLVYLIVISTLGPLQFGFHLAELNAPQDVITCKKRSVADDLASQPDSSDFPICIPMTEAAFATLSSMFVVGGLLGALLAGPTSTSYGRLLSMRITSAFFILGSVLQTFASHVPVMSVGRLLTGVGAGAATVIVPLYISEIAPPKERGLFGFMTQIAINIGILLTQTLGYYLSQGSLWRIILGVGAGIGLVHAIGLIFVPESPAWLANHDSERARLIFRRIHGPDASIKDSIPHWDSPKPLTEEETLLQNPDGDRRDSIATSHKASPPPIGFFAIVKDPFYQPAILAVVGIMVAQQFCGINSIMMYSVSLLSGVLPISSSLLTIMISIVNLITTIACAPLADKIGRKACLLLSIAGMGSMAFCLGLSMVLGIKLLSAISVLLFVAFFATGLGPVPFMMASELVGQEAVGATQSLCLAANYVATYVVAQFFPILNTWLNGRLGGSGWAFFTFSVCALLSFGFVSWKVPETKGKKDADEVWGRIRRED